MSHLIKKTGKVGEATFVTTLDTSTGATSVQIKRSYTAGNPKTSDCVWRIISDFGGAKTLFPSMVSVYNTYPDNTANLVNMVRTMAFAPAKATSPMSAQNPLSTGIEQLTSLDNQARHLTYTSVLGLPVKDYHSVMQVTGKNACELTWTSSFQVDAKDKGQVSFISVLVNILAMGANQIATALGV